MSRVPRFFNCSLQAPTGSKGGSGDRRVFLISSTFFISSTQIRTYRTDVPKDFLKLFGRAGFRNFNWGDGTLKRWANNGDVRLDLQIRLDGDSGTLGGQHPWNMTAPPLGHIEWVDRDYVPQVCWFEQLKTTEKSYNVEGFSEDHSGEDITEIQFLTIAMLI